LLTAASRSSTAALGFYQSPARQYLFYLEALTLIYKDIHNRKRFEKMRAAFKSLEDQLGKIDYFDSFIKEFSAQKDFPVPLLENLKQHYTEELNLLYKLLKKDGWLGDDASMLKWINKKLETAGWLKALKDRKEIAKVIIREIKKITDEYASGKLNFKTIENGVHEFRRRLRWISIYAQALDGLIQLAMEENTDPQLAIYLTKETLESPFNKLPENKTGLAPIIIRSTNFYALSWLIAESGRLKDEGLRIICVEDAIRETRSATDDAAKQMSRKLAVNSKHTLHEIKEQMKLLADDFINTNQILMRIEQDISVSINA
jgi:hypothetical protein